MRNGGRFHGHFFGWPNQLAALHSKNHVTDHFGFRVFVDECGAANTTLRFDVGFRIDETDELGPEYYFGLNQSF